MSDDATKSNLADIFGESSDEEADDVTAPPAEKISAEPSAPATAATAKKAAVDSDSDDELELDSDSDEEDDTESRLAELVSRQKKEKKQSKRRASAKKRTSKPRKRRAGAAPGKSKNKRSADDLDLEGVETAEDRAFIERGSDDDGDDDDVVRTEGGWTEDQDIEGDDDIADKKWLDQMWGRNKLKKREKTEEQFKEVAMAFKAKMEEAADDDQKANSEGNPAMKRLLLLPEVRTTMRKDRLIPIFLEDCGILGTFKRWLEPLNGKVFPNYNLKHGVLEILNELTNPEVGGIMVNPDQVKETGIGGIVNLYRLKDKKPAIRNLAQQIIDRWSRPILGTGSHSMHTLHKVVEKGDGQRISKVVAKREKKAVVMDTKMNQDEQKLEAYLQNRAAEAKIGEAGFAFHAGWPMPGEKNFKKNVMQDSSMRKLEKRLEDQNIALEDWMKDKKGPREIDRTINRTTTNNKRRRMQAVKTTIDSRSVAD